jgi:hypothetical protein
MNLDEKSPTFFDDFFAEKLKGKKTAERQSA